MSEPCPYLIPAGPLHVKYDQWDFIEQVVIPDWDPRDPGFTVAIDYYVKVVPLHTHVSTVVEIEYADHLFDNIDWDDVDARDAWVIALVVFEVDPTVPVGARVMVMNNSDYESLWFTAVPPGQTRALLPTLTHPKLFQTMNYGIGELDILELPPTHLLRANLMAAPTDTSGPGQWTLAYYQAAWLRPTTPAASTPPLCGLVDDLSGHWDFDTFNGSYTPGEGVRLPAWMNDYQLDARGEWVKGFRPAVLSFQITDTHYWDLNPTMQIQVFTDKGEVLAIKPLVTIGPYNMPVDVEIFLDWEAVAADSNLQSLHISEITAAGGYFEATIENICFTMDTERPPYSVVGPVCGPGDRIDTNWWLNEGLAEGPYGQRPNFYSDEITIDGHHSDYEFRLRSNALEGFRPQVLDVEILYASHGMAAGNTHFTMSVVTDHGRTLGSMTLNEAEPVEGQTFSIPLDWNLASDVDRLQFFLVHNHDYTRIRISRLCFSLNLLT